MGLFCFVCEAKSYVNTNFVSPSLYALLIGINTYNGHKSTAGTRGSKVLTSALDLDLPVFPDLYGAVPDAERFQNYLKNNLNADPTSDVRARASSPKPGQAEPI